jgi:hypothetical protein
VVLFDAFAFGEDRKRNSPTAKAVVLFHLVIEVI